MNTQQGHASQAMRTASKDGHDGYDDFIMRTYPIIGAAVIGLAAFGARVEGLYATLLFWLLWLELLACFIRFAIASYATFKYKFAMGNRDAANLMNEESVERWTNEEQKWKNRRMINVRWYGFALVLVVIMIVLAAFSSTFNRYLSFCGNIGGGS